METDSADLEPFAFDPLDADLDARARVNFLRDGIDLSPGDFGRLLARLADNSGIARDEYAEGGVVTEVEEHFARELGKPAALYLPTGTLANHLALRGHLPSGGRVFLQAESHVYRDSGDAAQALSGLNLVPLGVGSPSFTPEEFESALGRNAREKVHVPAAAVSIESPVRRFDGRCFPQDDLRTVLEIARGAGAATHRDGARIYFEAAWRGTDVAILAAPFDSVNVTLHKCFNAPSGAVLVGEADWIERLRPWRRAFGGAPAGAWPSAAVALHFARGYAPRIAAAVRRAGRLLEGLDGMPGSSIERLDEGTHVARLHLRGADALKLRERLAARRVAIPPPREEQGRATFDLRLNESLLHMTPSELLDAWCG